ncbi:MAG: ABC transporter substrate-binding protein [Spirochaetes bacterium]|uniref:ABC transporter substrate-binding protein n=1 Tax=Candidatus Ornithospirochaeta stercoripullorum TaxID=2840899 RepID=A0A9D9E0R2_9SPIO|nr:ABC transporter substrate-binding protein [Candidatus Ornithospirochaeta stercoripullorum]
MKKFISYILVLFAALSALSAADISVAALRGPTSMGLVSLMNESEKGSVNGNSYTFQIEGAADAVVPLIVRGDVDVAAIPGNLASVLYNNTKGKIEVIAINTLGVLYIVENGDSVHSVEDLRGRTIYSAGKGATPEYALQYVLAANGLEVGKDVFIEWKSEHAECVAALKADSEGVAMLPQPFATTAMISEPSIRIALDLNELWQDKVGSVLITGVTVARKDWAEANPAALSSFLDSYSESVNFINSDIEAGAKLVGKYGIVPENVAKVAIPYCQVTLITGNEMKTALSEYLEILFAQNPKSVGGALPADDFYYTGE